MKSSGGSCDGPLREWQWYDQNMSGTYAVVMGDRGRLVIPAELRARRHLTEGTNLLLVETSEGIILATRDQAKALIRANLDGVDLVGELLTDRRRQAAAEDSA